jgi:hypothetical protein
MLLLSLRLLVDLEDGAVLSCETSVKFIRLHGVTTQKVNYIVFHFKAFIVSHTSEGNLVFFTYIIITRTTRIGSFVPTE